MSMCLSTRAGRGAHCTGSPPSCGCRERGSATVCELYVNAQAHDTQTDGAAGGKFNPNSGWSTDEVEDPILDAFSHWS